MKIRTSSFLYKVANSIDSSEPRDGCSLLSSLMIAVLVYCFALPFFACFFSFIVGLLFLDHGMGLTGNFPPLPDMLVITAKGAMISATVAAVAYGIFCVARQICRRIEIVEE